MELQLSSFFLRSEGHTSLSQTDAQVSYAVLVNLRSARERFRWLVPLRAALIASKIAIGVADVAQLVEQLIRNQ